MAFVNDTLLHNKDNTIALVTATQIRPGKKIGVDVTYLQDVLNYIRMISEDTRVIQISLVRTCDDTGPLLGIRVPDGDSWFVIAPINCHTDALEMAE